MEIPQVWLTFGLLHEKKIYDWPSMYPFLLVMNGTILPQLIYAHIFMCLIAQVETNEDFARQKLN